MSISKIFTAIGQKIDMTFFGQPVLAEPEFPLQILDDHAKRIRYYDGRTYERDSSYRWRDLDTGNQAEHCAFMDMCRIHTKHTKTPTFQKEPYEAITDPETGAKVEYFGGPFLASSPMRITFKDGEQHVTYSLDIWYHYPDFEDCSHSLSRKLRDINGRVQFLKQQEKNMRTVNPTKRTIVG